MRFLTVMALAAAASMAAYGDTIPGLFNTGVDNSNQLLAGGSTDSHWTISGGFSGSAVVMSDSNLFGGCCGLNAWMTNGPNSKWVSTSDARFVPTGTMFYTTTFDLTGLDPSTASITGGMAADGNVIDVLLNGISTAQGTSFDTWNSFTSFSLSSGFHAGQNTLAFEVNHEDGDFDGFRAELSGTARVGSTAAPEPGSLALVGCAFMVLGFAGFRKRMQFAEALRARR